MAEQGGYGWAAHPQGLPCSSPLSAGIAARDAAQALRSLSQAARGVAASTEDPQAQAATLDCAGDVMDKASSLIREARKAVSKPGDAESQQRLAQVSPAAWLGLFLLGAAAAWGGELSGRAGQTLPVLSVGGQGRVPSPEPLCQLSARSARCRCGHPHGWRG